MAIVVEGGGIEVRPEILLDQLGDGGRLVAMQADDKGVEIRTYDVIYHITEDITKAAEGMPEPELRQLGGSPPSLTRAARSHSPRNLKSTH